jgi:uncharacterized protein
MSQTMSRASIPMFVQYLTNLSNLLDKAEAHAANRKIDPAALLGARLYPDMFPLTGQVQLACDFAKGAAARLAGIPVPSYEDSETSFAELRARIAKTLDFIGLVDASLIDGSETRCIRMNSGGRAVALKGEAYLIGYAIPNVIFHVTTAYAILRHNGVEIGKASFLGPMPGL